MNYDRLRARVWDKREKKMIYVPDYEGNVIYYTKHGAIRCNLINTSHDGICLQPMHKTDLADLLFIPFGDRFIPMQCDGSFDKNKKLIYESDICKDRKGDLFIMAYSIKMLVFQSIKSENDLLTPMEIIGNRWEQPELWE